MKTVGRPQSDNIQFAPVVTPDPYDMSPGPLSELPYPGGSTGSLAAQQRVRQTIQDKSRKERDQENQNYNNPNNSSNGQ